MRLREPSTAPVDRSDSIDRRDRQDGAEPIDTAEPIDSTAPNEPMLPIDSTDPREPMGRGEPVDHRGNREFRGAIAASWPLATFPGQTVRPRRVTAGGPECSCRRRRAELVILLSVAVVHEVESGG
jgi:hypothetical protein